LPAAVLEMPERCYRKTRILKFSKQIKKSVVFFCKDYFFFAAAFFAGALVAAFFAGFLAAAFFAAAMLVSTSYRKGLYCLLI
jgi:hypothetical protein